MTLAYLIHNFRTANGVQRSSVLKLLPTVVATAVLFCNVAAYGQQSVADSVASPAIREFEEIVINFEVQRLLNVDIFAQYDGESIYLPVRKVLEVLGMQATIASGKSRLTGHLNTKSEKVEIDISRKKIRTPYFDGKITDADYAATDNEIYVRIDLFESFFGLPVIFYFDELRAFLPLDKKFPTYQRIKRDLAHKTLREKQVVLSDVHNLPRGRNYLTGGVADWSLSANPIDGGEQFANLNIGGMILDGDVNVALAGDTRQGFDANQLRMRWRRHFEDKPGIAQVELGDVFTGSSLSRSLRGGRITNKPLTQRRFFETLNLSGELGANWEVELYVDGRLKDYVTTDVEGKYDFNLDVFYGASVITLKMYGPNGETFTEERYRRIPFNLIPRKQLDYDFGIGKQETFDTSNFYTNGSVSYGLTSKITLGAGLDIPMLDSGRERALFAGELAFQMLPNLTLNTSLSPNNALTYGLSYTQANVNLAATYEKLYENSPRNILNQIDKVTFSISSPFRIKNRSVGVRFHATMDRFPTFKTTNMNYGFNASLSRIDLNYIGKYKINSSLVSSTRDISSQLFATLSISSLMRPQIRIEYNHTTGSLTKYGVFLSQRVLRTGQVTLSFERNPLLGTNTATFTLSLLTDFASLTSRSLATAGKISVNQLYRGSVRYDENTVSVLFDKDNGVGLGSAIVQPFLDDNYNGRQDEGEEELKEMRAKIDGAGGAPIRGGSMYYYDRLRPYDAYIVKLDEYSLDDPQLKPLHENYRVVLNPNMVTSIKVPVVTASDVMGSIKRTTDVGPVGVGGIKVVIFNVSRDIMTQVGTFNDGEFYHLGLLPGRYRAYIDPEQLESFGYKASPASIEFEIKPEPGGSTIEGIDFLLSPALADIEVKEK